MLAFQGALESFQKGQHCGAGGGSDLDIPPRYATETAIPLEPRHPLLSWLKVMAPFHVPAPGPNVDCGDIPFWELVRN
jgi:hypothetical protein